MSTAETLNAVGRWLVPFLVQLSLELAVLAGIVVALLFALRVRSPRLRSAFWAMVLAKPVVSLLIASPVSLYGFLQPAALAPPVLPARMVSVAGQRPPLAVPADLPQSVLAAPPATPASPAWGEGLDRYGAASLLWGVVTACLALRLFLGMAFVTFLRRTAAWQRAGPLAAVARIAAQTLGLRQPLPVALSTVPRGPVLAGLFRPAALLPVGLAQQLSEEQLLLIVAHESVHARHRDNLLLLLRRLAESLLFFHPVVWLSGSALGREVESACDEAVVAAFGARATYAGALVEVAALARHAGPAPVHHLLLTTFAASESGFGRRVRRVLHGRHRPMPYSLAVVSLVVLAVVGAVGLPRARGAASPDATNAQPERSPFMTPATDQDASPASTTDGTAGTVPAASAPIAPAQRRVLEGVPKVAYQTDRWRFTPFCHSLSACLQFLGEGDQYDRLMAISGAGFRTVWAPRMWDGGNSDILGMARQTLEPMRRAFWGAGYQMIPVAREQADGWPQDILRGEAQRLGGMLTDEAGFRRQIIASIDRGRPVIAFGVIGPPEACVITGYDEGGEVLIGWNEFQDHEGAETETSGYFRRRNWYPKTHALLLLGERVGPPAADQLYHSTLLWAVEVLCTSAVGGHAAGPAAFDAWAADMTDDQYFPAGNEKVLHARLDCHWDGMTMQAERATVVPFLLEAAAHEPAMAGELRAAAEALQQAGIKHGVAPGERDQIARLADPQVRREVAASILATREAYQRTADHLELALLAAGILPEQIPRLLASGPASTGPTPNADPAQSLVLEGVPKIGFGVIDGHVERTPFPACMRAILEYLGDDLGLSQGKGFDRDAVYAYLMGTTGAAFRLNWNPGWHGDNVASWLLSDDPGEISRRGFAAAGYMQIAAPHGSDDLREATFRRLVKESIRDRRRPLIAHGVIGPPEEAIIAGYGEGGAAVMGWSFFQDDAIGQAGVEFLPNGYFRKRNWVADTWSLIAFGDKTGDPPRRETYIEAIKWGLHVSREPVRYGGRYSGLAAYEAWAEQILRDGEVAAGGGPDDAFTVHSDAVDVVAEGRHYAGEFLNQAAGVLPEAGDDLLAAAQCYQTEHDLMWRIWGIVGGNQRGAAHKQSFLQPENRRRIAVLIRQARDQDAAAGDRLERALRTLGVPSDQIAPSPPPGLPELQRQSGPHLLEGLEFPKWAITELGCTHACLDHLGVKISRAWLYGGTARAFLINIHEDVDVEAVTAFRRDRLLALSPNLGFRVEGFSAEKEASGDQYPDRQREAWTFVRSHLGRDVPCYGWELKPPYGDYWIITGYDDLGYYYTGWETGGPTPWQKLGDQFIPVLDVRSLEPCPAASDAVVVREAFRTANWLAEHPKEWTVAEDAHGGPEAYEAWAVSLETEKAILNHHAYNAWAWHETREMAVAFLEEAKGRLGRTDLDPLFDAAIGNYAVVRDRLAAVMAKYPMPKSGWDNDTKIQDAEAAAALRQAGKAERQGLAVLGQIAAKLE